MKARKSVVYLTIFLLFALVTSARAAAIREIKGTHIDDALKKLNTQIRAEKLALKELSAGDLKRWFADILPLTVVRRERDAIEQNLLVDRLPGHWSLKVVKSDGSAPDRIVLSGGETELNVQLGNQLALYSESLKGRCTEAVCDEPFKGDALKTSPMDFPKSVPLAIAEVQAGGEALGRLAARDALWIQLRLNRKNISDLAAYFAVGRAQADLLRYFDRRLGARSEVWIDLQDIFQNWLSHKIGSLPTRADHLESFAVTREFYFDKQSSLDVAGADSVELFEAFLSRHYCQVADGVEPRFGDVIYIPGVHAGRFILKDPVSGRGVGLSLHAKGSYRFWWIDEDFSLKPFARTPERDLRQSRVDFWRRCK